jgi:methylglutaconyl-CoA hydratase
MAKGFKYLEVRRRAGILYIWLNRPKERNAFDDVLITELTQAFSRIPEDIRVVVLGGRGDVFCAGADLEYMKRVGQMGHEENIADANALAEMLAVVNDCPVPLVGRVQKAAFGGAIGLVACCDSVFAAEDAVFAFSEVRLGLSPATISPYVIAKIGENSARDLFLSGEKWDAKRAKEIGLVHYVVKAEVLDSAVNVKAKELLKAGPKAARATKQLIADVTGSVALAMRDSTARLIAELRASEEGREGLTAFMEKRKPSWTDK